MPDVEYTIIAHREHQETAVRRDAGQGSALAKGCSIEHQFARTELTGFGIEGLLVDVVLHFLEALEDFQARVDGVLSLKVGATVVKRLAVGCPVGEDLKLVGVVLDIRHLIALHVVGYQVTLDVIDLNLVGVRDMECLYRFVGRIDNELLCGMPGGIDTGREHRVVAHVDLLNLSVVGNNGAAKVLTGMELHAVRVVLLVVVTIDALALSTLCAEHVAIDDVLIIVLKTTLADGQVFVGDV